MGSRFRIGIFFCGLMGGLACLGGLHAEEFYQGKTVTLIVGNATGGGYDANARVLARYMSKYIPGQPNVVVKNMPGAGGLVAANYMYSVAEPDGLTFALLSRSTPLSPMLGVAAARYNVEKSIWLGTSSSYADNAYFLITMGGTPFRTIDDLRGNKPLAQFGGLGAGGTDTDIVLAAKDVLGLNINLIRGYKASADIGMAMERGEIEGRSIGWTSLQLGAYANLVKEGRINFLVQFGREKRWARMPDVPTARELAKNDADRALIELVEFPFQVTYPYVAPPGVPADRAAILKSAFMQTFSDSGYLAEAEKLEFDISPVPGDQVKEQIVRLSQTPPDVIKRYKAILDASQ